MRCAPGVRAAGALVVLAPGSLGADLHANIESGALAMSLRARLRNMRLLAVPGQKAVAVYGRTRTSEPGSLGRGKMAFQPRGMCGPVN
jgi:hypothetical protein